MPVPAQIGRTSRNDHEMPDPRLDPRLAPGAHIRLARLIRLDRVDGFMSVNRVVVVKAGFHGTKVAE